ncbi:unnamed protein product [Nesidiocoris tenuis]|uniref:Uncharacterized protein n=1 Tax=Nesidiocoris tenuis TaxID=355587 RepID=A0A6H5GPV0_9HEMI|nr:unnamed protein product [Nesidiocoris tenuis]
MLNPNPTSFLPLDSKVRWTAAAKARRQIFIMAPIFDREKKTDPSNIPERSPRKKCQNFGSKSFFLNPRRTENRKIEATRRNAGRNAEEDHCHACG